MLQSPKIKISQWEKLGKYKILHLGGVFYRISHTIASCPKKLSVLATRFSFFEPTRYPRPQKCRHGMFCLPRFR